MIAFRPFTPALATALTLFLCHPIVGVADAPKPIELWPAGAPGEKGDVGEERDTTTPKDGLIAGKRLIRLGNVSKPTISIYRPPADKDTGAAVLVCPGGAYNILALDLEGTEVCEWLNSIGVTGVLLKYRVPRRAGLEKHAAPLQDAQRAMGMLRAQAAKLGIDPKRIGVLGFSAGGHLAAALSNNHAKRSYLVSDDADKASCRPDFTLLIYPAYLTVKEQDDKLAPELPISKDTPPTFIAMSQDDPVRSENALLYSLALKRANVPVQLHLYPTGGHGYGLRRTNQLVTTWPDRAAEWLRSGGWVTKHVGDAPSELSALLEKARVKHDVPALAAGILHGDAKPRLAVVGVRRRGDEALAMDHDQWHLGSNTKPMTALLIAMLIEMGLLDWDTPLEQIFPEHAEQWSADLKKITPQHLLTHTSGLPGAGPLLFFQLGGTDGSPLKDRARTVQSLDTIKMTNKPGEKYEYSNLGYVVLGAIIDRRGKATWEEQLEKKVFQPLGIKHWSIGPGTPKDAVTQPWPHMTNGKPVAANGVMDNPQVLNSAGRVRMSVGDYTTFLAEYLKLARGDKGLLKPATAKKLFTNPHAVSPHTLSGWVSIGKQPGKLVLAHDGSNTMNYCTTILVPDQNLGFCVLTNQGGPGGPGSRACLDVLRQFREQEKR